MKKATFIDQWYVVFGLVMLLILAGCATGGKTPVDPAVLVIAAPKGNEAAALQEAAAVYKKESGQAVRVEALGTDAYIDQVSAVLLAGQERYDLVYLPADSLARWAMYHAIRPAPAGLDTRPLEPWLAPLTIKGQLYGLPVNPDPLVLWYRTDLLSQKLPAPGDWQAVAKAAQVMNTSTPAERYPLALAGSDMDGGRDFAAILAGFGGQMVTDTYQVDLQSAQAQEALKYMVGMVRAGLASPETAKMTRAEVISALAKGKAGMGLAPLSAGQQLQDCSASAQACKDGQPLLDWVNLPGLDETTAQGELSAWVLPLHAPHTKAAEQFAAWLVSEQGARAWAQAGGIPAHQGVLAALPQPTSAKTHPLSYRQARLLAGLKSYRLAFPPAPNAESLWKAANGVFHTALVGEQPSEQILADANDAIQRALRQDGLLP